MTQKAIHWVSGNVNTTDGTTATTICQFDLSSAATSPTGVLFDNCGVYCQGTIIGYNGTALVAGTQVIARGFQRISGTLTAIDSAILTVVAGLLPVGIATSTFNIIVSGNIIKLQVTGIAATTINWFGDMQMRIFQP